MSNNNSKYTMRIGLNVLNHLGMNLYSNVPAVLSEVVANSWDASATEVRINIYPNQDEIVISDNGIGMSLEEINEKFLTVGYAKRQNGELKSKRYERAVMGRKGIGKLSLFSIANNIKIYTKKENEFCELNQDNSAHGFMLDTNEIRKKIGTNDFANYSPEDIEVDNHIKSYGTKIVLTKIKKRLNNTSTALQKRLARRFSVLGDKHNFRVFLNNKEIKVEDRDYFHKIEYLWVYGKDSDNFINYAQNATQTELRENILNGGHEISGWLGLVKESGQLQDGDDNLNKIVLLMRGKLAKEDILEEFREGGLYTKYLFGEISADFLDEDNQQDIATSSRQSVFEEDPRYIALRDFIEKELKRISSKRAEYKSTDAVESLETMPEIKEWYSSLGKDTKSKAKKLFSKINQIAVDKKHQKQLFSHGVLAFESLRYKDALDSLEKVSLLNLNEFLTIFKEFDKIEATLYYKITKERLEIINTLQRLVLEEDALEKILQEYLFEYLWLLDPSWDRATETPLMEQTVKTAFDKINNKLSKEELKGRVDIRYKKSSGKHVIIELKRASVKTDTFTLQRQVNKYKSALKKLIKTNERTTSPSIECICILGKEPTNWDDLENREESIRQMAIANTRVVTYQQLINDSQNSYREYLEKNKEAGKIISLIQKIEDED